MNYAKDRIELRLLIDAYAMTCVKRVTAQGAAERDAAQREWSRAYDAIDAVLADLYAVKP